MARLPVALVTGSWSLVTELWSLIPGFWYLVTEPYVLNGRQFGIFIPSGGEGHDPLWAARRRSHRQDSRRQHRTVGGCAACRAGRRRPHRSEGTGRKN